MTEKRAAARHQFDAASAELDSTTSDAACIFPPVHRPFSSLLALAFVASCALLIPRAANVDAALVAGVRSGEHVRWTPNAIASLVRVLRDEGAERAVATELAQIVHSEARALHVDPLYALALMKVESNFHANAVSPRGAVGLLQIRPATARGVVAVGRNGVARRPARVAHGRELRDPRTNVVVGLRYLRDLENQFADRTTALAAYNLGPTRVRRRLQEGTPVPRAYTDRVLAAYRSMADRSDATAARLSPSDDG